MTYKDIKPLIDDTSVTQNRLLCRFRDPHNDRVVLSAADIDLDVETVTHFDFLRQALMRFSSSKSKRLSASERAAVVKAFEKVDHMFEESNGQLRIKEL